MLGLLIAKFESWRAGTKVIGSEISTRLTGRVVLIEHQANGRVRLTIDVTATARPVLRYAPDRVRVSARKYRLRIIAGRTWRASRVCGRQAGPVRPDSYDFSFESYFDGIGANGFFLSGPDLVEASATPGVAARFARRALKMHAQRLPRHIRERIGGVEGEIAARLSSVCARAFRSR